MFAAFASVVADGGAFPRKPPADEAMFREAWLDAKTTVQVARLGPRPAGSYFLRPAFPGLASHIANAGYLVARELRGRGIGCTLAEHSFDEARRRGFRAMIFNLVREDNPSNRLWTRLGFELVGRVPDALEGHAALIYWREL